MAYHALQQTSIRTASARTATLIQHRCTSQRQRLPIRTPCRQLCSQLARRHSIVKSSKIWQRCCLPSDSQPLDASVVPDHSSPLPAARAASDASPEHSPAQPHAIRSAVHVQQTPFHTHLLKQILTAAGALLLLYFLFSSLSSCLQIAKPLITDSPPAAVWLPRPQIQPQPATMRQHWLAAANFASSSITATSSQIMRIPDSFYVQCTATLQQVNHADSNLALSMLVFV